MENNRLSNSFYKPDDLDQMLKDLRNESVVFALISLVLLGFVSIFSASHFSDMLQGGITGLLFFGLALLCWYLQKFGFSLSGWCLSFGCLIIIWFLSAWSGNGAFLYLLIVPVGLTVSLVGLSAGFFVAICVTGSLLWLPHLFSLNGSESQFIAIVCVWAIYGLIWLALHPSSTITSWSWANYELNRDLLEQVRTSNLQAQEALKDLSDANLQLIRLNDLAHSLQLTAEEARKTKEQFVANVSHELRTPLNMIIGFSEMIMQTPKEIYGSRISPKLLADLDVILRNSQHLSKLIDDVLDLSQVDAGLMSFSQTIGSMEEIIRAAVVSVQPLFQNKGLSLTVEIPEDLPEILCDFDPHSPGDSQPA